MNKVKILIFDDKITVATIQFVGLFSVAVIAPLFGHQLITGTVVNFILFITVFLLGIESATLISLFPSLIALGTGILPLTLAPIIPFIIASNIILIMVFKGLSKTNLWSAMISASITKFAFLTIVGLFAASFSGGFSSFITLINGTQLITSLSGGLGAILFIQILWKNKIKK